VGAKDLAAMLEGNKTIAEIILDGNEAIGEESKKAVQKLVSRNNLLRRIIHRGESRLLFLVILHTLVVEIYGKKKMLLPCSTILRNRKERNERRGKYK